jgi:hypothetical protein
MVMEPISLDKARTIAGKKSLKPGRVKGTDGIQFTKGGNSRLEIIGWEEFEKTLGKRNLAFLPRVETFIGYVLIIQYLISAHFKKFW